MEEWLVYQITSLMQVQTFPLATTKDSPKQWLTNGFAKSRRGHWPKYEKKKNPQNIQKDRTFSRYGFDWQLLRRYTKPHPWGHGGCQLLQISLWFKLTQSFSEPFVKMFNCCNRLTHLLNCVRSSVRAQDINHPSAIWWSSVVRTCLLGPGLGLGLGL